MSERVTTVIMTRNRWADLSETLPRHRGPVVVVDNGSSDGTPARVRRDFPRVELIRLSSNEGAVARNHGVRAARTPYIAFADDDSWWEEGALFRATEILDLHPRVGVVAGRIVVGDDRRPDPVSELMARSPLPRPHDFEGIAGVPILGFVACGAVVRRDAFLEAGGFDPVVHFPGEEERLALDLAVAGWELVYADHVVARHRPSPHRPPTTRRRALERRNELLTAIMRRPWPVVHALEERLRRDARHDRAARLALAGAAARTPRALLRRRELPEEIERLRRMLDQPRP
jgi:GT2 family glycosyltransferase